MLFCVPFPAQDVLVRDMMKLALLTLITSAAALKIQNQQEESKLGVKAGKFSFLLDPVESVGAGFSPKVKWAYQPVLDAIAKAKLDNPHAWTLLDMSPFAAVDNSFGLLPESEIDHSQFRSFGMEGNKNLIKMNHGKCVVYGAGIASDSSFEQSMADRGCEVHAFDCTLKGDEKSVANKDFKFHNWCLGTPESFDDNMYSKSFEDKSTESAKPQYQFQNVSETMNLLGHDKIDVLKFDIEGFEWNLFQNDLMTGLLTNQTTRPKQLAFELHTQHANPYAVPHHVVVGKNKNAVTKLFRDLHDLGYRVISKEINPLDWNCAEFVLVDTKNLI